MLIQKGGITRNIDEERLHEYAAKGYEPVVAVPEPEAPVAPPAEPPEKQPKKATAKE